MNGKKRKYAEVHGWVILDKPVGMTSTQAVGKVKRLFNCGKAGHAGTLDPLASGCLPIALGEATKTVSFVMDGRKVYRFTVRWGIETTTDDTEGPVAATSDIRPEPDAIRAILPEFTGEILQVPPAFSAVKIDGERAYDLARDGETVELEARPIQVHRLDLVSTPDADTAVFDCECGKGTYVRALARDMGRRLGTRGHVIGLRRLLTGPFGEDDMIGFPDIEAAAVDGAVPPENHEQVMLPVETALEEVPEIPLTRDHAARLRSGQAVILRGRDAPLPGPAWASCQGEPVAIGEVMEGMLHPRRVFLLPNAGA